MTLLIPTCSVWVLQCLLLVCALSALPARASYSHAIKDLSNHAASLKIHGRKGWLPTDVSKMQLVFSPPLEQGVDFTIWAEPNNHVMPEQFLFHRNHSTPLIVLLTPGKRWVKNMRENTTQDLRLVHIRSGKTDVVGYKNNIQGQENVVARITNFPETTRLCPSSLVLPDATQALQSKVDHVLRHCQDPLFIRSRQLKWRRHHSLNLLLLQPSILFVDGSDQPLQQAAKSVDLFLAAHSVLDVAWEPMSEDEPQYWVLMPRPLGMPGHLFAAMDAVQWSHPLVIEDASVRQRGRPSCAGQQCVAGCKHTKLAGITGSGYSADAFNIYEVLRQAFMRNLPVQAFPSTLGKRSTPPSRFE
jgi:hypothetical protein